MKPALTAEQVAVLRLAADGHRYRDIAQKLRITEHTVKNRVRDAGYALSTNSITHTVVEALRRSLLDEESTMSTLHSPDSVKSLRETFCEAQAAIGSTCVTPFPPIRERAQEHLARLQRLIDDCDQQRPLGPDGVHGDRHTATCGCEDKPTTTGDATFDPLLLEAAELEVS